MRVLAVWISLCLVSQKGEWPIWEFIKLYFMENSNDTPLQTGDGPFQTSLYHRKFFVIIQSPPVYLNLMKGEYSEACLQI